MATTTTPEISETELTPDLIERVLKALPESRERLLALLSNPPVPELPPVGDWAYWKAEIKRRIEDVQSGRVKAFTLEETLDHIQKALDERRKS